MIIQPLQPSESYQYCHEPSESNASLSTKKSKSNNKQFRILSLPKLDHNSQRRVDLIDSIFEQSRD